MPLTNAMKQARWRARQSKLAAMARSAPISRLIAARIRAGTLSAKDRLRSVQLLIEGADDAELIGWLKAHVRKR
jgi:hypothetical protein